LQLCRLTVIYTGRVQGVGFRYTAKTVATGFDGDRHRAQSAGRSRGTDCRRGATELEAFRTAISDEGLAGFIRDEQVSWDSAQNKFRGFEIISLE
jgi:acylphosphatase